MGFTTRFGHSAHVERNVKIVCAVLEGQTLAKAGEPHKLTRERIHIMFNRYCRAAVPELCEKQPPGKKFTVWMREHRSLVAAKLKEKTKAALS